MDGLDQRGHWNEAEAKFHEAEAKAFSHEAEAACFDLEAACFDLEADAKPRGLTSLVSYDVYMYVFMNVHPHLDTLVQ